MQTRVLALSVAASLSVAVSAQDDPIDRFLKEQPAATPRDAGRSTESAPLRQGDLFARQVGGAAVRLIDLSVDALFAAGTSTEKDEPLQRLQGGGHDPRKRGFTVQNVELSATAAVDPYLSAELHLVYFIDPLEGESRFELEEAFLTTQALPAGLQIKGGFFFTEFGRINAQHPHQWDWQDAPVVNTRFFGPDGMRQAGARMSWLSPLPWYSVLVAGLQNANGETMASFLSNEELAEERPLAGRPFVERDVHNVGDLAYLLRWENGFDLSREWSSKAGASFLYGPNSTGEAGETLISGADWVVKWRSTRAERGWPFVIWQSEAILRTTHADDALDEGADPVDPADDTLFASETFQDWGFYTQVLYGFVRNWAAGVRYEFAGGEELAGDRRNDDPFRNDRHRVAPLVVYHPTEFSRLRFQYNWDHAETLTGGEAHSIWLGVEILFGSHPAHSY